LARSLPLANEGCKIKEKGRVAPRLSTPPTLTTLLPTLHLQPCEIRRLHKVKRLSAVTTPMFQRQTTRTPTTHKTAPSSHPLSLPIATHLSKCDKQRKRRFAPNVQPLVSVYPYQLFTLQRVYNKVRRKLD